MVAASVLVGCAPLGDETQPQEESSATGDAEDEDADGAQASTGEQPDTTGAPGGPEDGTFTYHRDVRPLIERHCVSCHQDGQIAPFAFTSYDEVWPLREAIAIAVAERSMPPWNPRPGCADYSGDPSLTDEELAMIAGWAAEDGPQGNPEEFVPPELPEPLELSRTDLSLTLPEPYTPQLQPDDYRCFLMDWPETETSFITGFQVQPDNLETVHHVITYAIEPGSVATYEALDEADPGPGYTCFGGPGGGSGDWAAGRWLGAWAPGARNTDFPEGTGLRMEPGSKVVVQIHYNSSADVIGPDQSTVDYKVDATVEREAYMMPWADPDWLSGGMRIPAGSGDTTYTWELDPTLALSILTDAVPAFQPIQIHSASHHMHLRGKAAQQVIKRKDGSDDCLVEIPNYDFNWQTRYRFVEPKVLEPGDVLSLTCQWDNADNDEDVNWGEGTNDEMCLGVYFVTPLP